MYRNSMLRGFRAGAALLGVVLALTLAGGAGALNRGPGTSPARRQKTGGKRRNPGAKRKWKVGRIWGCGGDGFCR